MAGYRSTQNFLACVAFTDDLPLPEVAGPPGEVKRISQTAPWQLEVFHVRGPDIEGKEVSLVRNAGVF